MLCVGGLQNLVESPHVIPMAVRGENGGDVNPCLARHVEDGGGVIGGIDKQALIAGGKQVAVIVHFRNGDLVKM